MRKFGKMSPDISSIRVSSQSERWASRLARSKPEIGGSYQPNSWTLRTFFEFGECLETSGDLPLVFTKVLALVPAATPLSSVFLKARGQQSETPNQRIS